MGGSGKQSTSGGMKKRRASSLENLGDLVAEDHVHHLIQSQKLKRRQVAAGGKDLSLPACCNKMCLVSKDRLELA
eukprot:4057813-Amphidinium_carterae.2